MREPQTILAAMMNMAWLNRPWTRRLIFFVAALVACVLCVWPQHYLAEAELLPQDSAGGLSAALAQGTGSAVVNLGSLIGNKQPVEQDLTIARSEAVINDVVDRLHLIGSPGYRTRAQAVRRIQKALVTESIRGSILQINATDVNPKVALAITAAGADAIQSRLTELNLAQTQQRKAVAINRMADASQRLLESQAALEQFRTVHHLAEPGQQLGLAVGLLATIQAEIQTKEVEISTLQHFSTPNNIRLNSLEVNLAALKAQESEAKSNSARDTSNPAWLSQQNAQYFNLYRDERANEMLYEVYKKYLEQVTIDELASNQNMFLMQPAYIHPERQYNIPAMGVLAMILILAFVLEFYSLTPPVGQTRA